MVSGTVKASFPSKLERTVASALLLLSSPPAISMNKSCCDSESFENLKLSISESSSGVFGTVMTVDDESSSAVVPARDHRLKVVRKKRSKSIWISDCQQLSFNQALSPQQAPESSDSASGIIASEVSSVSSARSCTNVLSATHKLRKPVSLNHMGQQAEAILRVLSCGSASEVRIRQLLGDSPSTSKALRMLLRRAEVKRSGAGGRGNPYIYMIA